MHGQKQLLDSTLAKQLCELLPIAKVEVALGVNCDLPDEFLSVAYDPKLSKFQWSNFGSNTATNLEVVGREHPMS